MCALAKGHAHVAQELLQHNANPNAVTGEVGRVLCCSVLCCVYAVPCCAVCMLCRAVLCLCCAVLWLVMLCQSMLPAQGWTPMLAACSNGHIGELKEMLANRELETADAQASKSRHALASVQPDLTQFAHTRIPKFPICND